MNKNLLIIGAAIGAYALLRPKSGSLISRTAYAPGSTAYSATPTYVPSIPRPAQPALPAWLATATGTVSTAAGLIKTGNSVWDDISGALHLGSGAGNGAHADVTADGSGSIWAGGNYDNYATS